MTYEHLKKQRTQIYESFAKYVLDLADRDRLDPENLELIRRHAAQTSDEIQAINETINVHIQKIADRAADNLR